MNSEATEVAGFVVRCDRYATVIEVVHDSLGSGLRAGDGFVEVLTTGSRPDGFSMLAAVRAGRAIDPVVLHLDVSTAATFHVAGTVGDGGGDLVLVGTTRLADLPVLAGVAGLAPAPVADLARSLSRTDADAPAQASDEAALDALSAANNSLVELHRELARANAELTRINARKDEIFAMVAHDLRNPLASIAGFGEALGRQLDSVLDDTSRLMLTRIGALSERMRSLVDDLLDTAAIEHRTLSLERETIDVRPPGGGRGRQPRTRGRSQAGAPRGRPVRPAARSFGRRPPARTGGRQPAVERDQVLAVRGGRHRDHQLSPDRRPGVLHRGPRRRSGYPAGDPRPALRAFHGREPRHGGPAWVRSGTRGHGVDRGGPRWLDHRRHRPGLRIDVHGVPADQPARPGRRVEEPGVWRRSRRRRW